MKKYLLAIILLLVLLCVCTCGGSSTPPPGELKILDHGLTTHEFTGGMPQSTAIVKGRAQNVGGSVINSAQIAVDFYAVGGRLVGTASTVTQNLKPGDIWVFSVQITGPDAWKSVKYKISSSTK